MEYDLQVTKSFVRLLPKAKVLVGSARRRKATCSARSIQGRKFDPYRVSTLDGFFRRFNKLEKMLIEASIPPRKSPRLPHLIKKSANEGGLFYGDGRNRTAVHIDFTNESTQCIFPFLFGYYA